MQKLIHLVMDYAPANLACAELVSALAAQIPADYQKTTIREASPELADLEPGQRVRILINDVHMAATVAAGSVTFRRETSPSHLDRVYTIGSSGRCSNVEDRRGTHITNSVLDRTSRLRRKQSLDRGVSFGRPVHITVLTVFCFLLGVVK